MTEQEVILRFAALLLLVGFLVYKQWQRDRKRAAFRRQFQREGDVINVAPLRPRLAAVRRDFTHAAHQHARSIQAREGLVAATRRKLGSLPFFRHHPAETEGGHHIA